MLFGKEPELVLDIVSATFFTCFFFLIFARFDQGAKTFSLVGWTQAETTPVQPVHWKKADFYLLFSSIRSWWKSPDRSPRIVRNFPAHKTRSLEGSHNLSGQIRACLAGAKEKFAKTDLGGLVNEMVRKLHCLEKNGVSGLFELIKKLISHKLIRNITKKYARKERPEIPAEIFFHVKRWSDSSNNIGQNEDIRHWKSLSSSGDFIQR